MRMSMQDGLSSGSLDVTCVVIWSKSKCMMHPKRIDSNVDNFTIIGKLFFTRALLETERRLFGNKKEITFVEIRENCDMRLLDREKLILLIDKRACQRKIMFSSVND